MLVFPPPKLLLRGIEETVEGSDGLMLCEIIVFCDERNMCGCSFACDVK